MLRQTKIQGYADWFGGWWSDDAVKGWGYNYHKLWHLPHYMLFENYKELLQI